MKNIFFSFLLYSLFAHGLEIKVITSSQIEQAKTLVVNTVYNVFNLSQSFEDFRQEMINTKQFYDIEHVEQIYLNNGGLFLVLLDGDTVVATGGIRRINENTAELKRMWMREEYRGKGWGKKIAEQLITFAKEHGYKKIILDVWKPEHQKPAVNLYKKLGFYEIEAYNNSPAQLFMEMIL